MRQIIALALAASFASSSFAHAQVYQPNMQEALQNLLAAEHEVQLAGQHRDHGGFAGRASVHIQAAINDVRQGIAYRNGGGT